MAYPKSTLPAIQSFNRLTALLTIATMDEKNPNSQPVLRLFFEHSEKKDTELQVAIASKLNPEVQDSRFTLHRLATDPKLDVKVGEAALARLRLIKSPQLRQQSYSIVREFREEKDDVWQSAKNGEEWLKEKNKRDEQKAKIVVGRVTPPKVIPSSEVASLEEWRNRKV